MWNQGRDRLTTSTLMGVVFTVLFLMIGILRDTQLVVVPAVMVGVLVSWTIVDACRAQARHNRTLLALHREEMGLCGGCGYDLRQSVDRCSECGLPLEYCVFLHNDSTHTFAEVVELLTAVLGVEPLFAWRLAAMAEQKGKTAIVQTQRKNAMDLCQLLQERGFLSSVVPHAKWQTHTGH